MKIETEKLKWLMPFFANGNHMTLNTLNNFISIYRKCRYGVTLKTLDEIRGNLDEDTINCIFGCHGFVDPNGKYTEEQNSSNFYQFGVWYPNCTFSVDKKLTLVKLTTKYVLPFCKKIYCDLIDKYKELYEDDVK